MPALVRRVDAAPWLAGRAGADALGRQVVPLELTPRVRLDVVVPLLNRLRRERLRHAVPRVVAASRVEQDDIMNRAVALCGVVRAAALPDDLIAEVAGTENRVQQELQVMAHRRIAVQVQGPGRLEHPVQFHQPRRHVHQVRHRVALGQQPVQRPQRRRGRPGQFFRQRVSLVQVIGCGTPVPGVVKRPDLRGHRLKGRRGPVCWPAGCGTRATRAYGSVPSRS